MNAKLLNLEVVFEADWFVQLQDPTDRHVEIAFVRFDHPSVPAKDQSGSCGVIITMETDDVDAVYDEARNRGLEVVLSLRDEEWGQRHFMTRDPEGLLVDVVKVIPPSAAFLAAYSEATE